MRYNSSYYVKWETTYNVLSETFCSQILTTPYKWLCWVIRNILHVITFIAVFVWNNEINIFSAPRYSSLDFVFKWMLHVRWQRSWFSINFSRLFLSETFDSSLTISGFVVIVIFTNILSRIIVFFLIFSCIQCVLYMLNSIVRISSVILNLRISSRLSQIEALVFHFVSIFL